MFSLTALWTVYTCILSIYQVRGYLVDSQDYRDGILGPYPNQTYSTHEGEFPIFNFDRLPSDTNSSEYILLAVRGDDVTRPGALIVDWSGGLVWDGTEYGETMSFSVQTYLGNPVIALWQGQFNGGGWGSGHLLLLDQTYQVVANVTTTLADQGHGLDFHEAQITPNDTALVLVYRLYEEENLLSGVVQEINVTSGEAIFTWDSRDHIDPEECYAGRTDAAWDYIHLNSIEKDTEGNYLVSSRHCHALYYIHPNGTILWTMGGKQSNFTNTTFSWQHDARWHGDQISLFDNGASTWENTTENARGVLIDINYEEMSIVETYFDAPTGDVSPSQGSFSKLGNGDWLAGWGSEPYLTQFDSNGTALWTAQFGIGQSSYRAIKANWTAYPTTNPSIQVNLPDTSGSSDTTSGSESNVTVRVSWSGATDVGYYLLLADSDEIGRSDHEQFEDVITVRNTTLDGKEWIQVAAYSLNGSALGWSDRFILGNETTSPPEQTRTVGTASFAPQSTQITQTPAQTTAVQGAVEGGASRVFGHCGVLTVLGLVGGVTASVMYGTIG